MSSMEKRFKSLAITNSSISTIPRAASCSELPSSCHRIFYEELNSCGSLVKQYSCEQIFDNNSKIRQLEISSLYTTGCGGESHNFQGIWQVKFPDQQQLENSKMKSSSAQSLDRGTKNDWNSTKNDLKECLPMKIKSEAILSKARENRRVYLNHQGRSDKTPQKIPIICIENSQVEDNSDVENTATTQVKKKLRSLMIEDSTNRSPQLSNGYLKIFFFSLVAFASVIISSLISEYNEKPFDFTNASLELNEKIFGQEKALKQLIDHFQHHESHFNAIILIGGTGVGKSYAIDILRNHFPYTYNIFEYYPPLEENIELAYNSLSSLHCNFVILENLKFHNVNDLVKFVDYFYKQEDRPCVTVLSVLNPQITDQHLIKTLDVEKSVKHVQMKFHELQLPVKIITFQPLTIDTIRRCIKEEGRRNNIQLSEKEIDDVLKQLIRSNSGCKRAYAKVQLNFKP